VEEFELLNALAAAGLQSPKPLWREADPSYAGRPFLLFPQYPGAAIFGDYEAPEAERRAVCHDVARLMARLHALDPYALGVAPRDGASPQEVVRQYVRFWRDKWRRRQVHPSIILETAFDWLERNAPASLPRVSLIHSDISFRNTLIDQGRLSVLLDWEFWHLGDPMEDLGYFRLVAEPYIPWDEFMRVYQEAGGEAYHPERAAFYEVWRSVRNSTTTTTAWNGFLSGAYPASKAAYQGVSLYRLFLRDVADKLGSVQL
jgi:aminoglycoside phosphotransferase (APT) family kinase protein